MEAIKWDIEIGERNRTRIDSITLRQTNFVSDGDAGKVGKALAAVAEG